jgi:dihydroorotase
MSRFGSLADAPASFRLVGARLIDPASVTDASGDLAVVDGVIAAPADAPATLPAFDASGLVVTPGFCDLGAQAGEAGVDDLARAAARGGWTSVCVASSAALPLTSAAEVQSVAGMRSSARLRPIAALTGGAEEHLAELGALAEAGAVAIGDAVSRSAALTRAALLYLAPLGLPLVVRPEEPTLAAGTLVRAGAVSSRLGLPGWPPSAELTVVERDLALAAETGGRVHFAHLSTAASVEAVRRARGAGVAATCSVTPHHLALTDRWVAGERRFAWEEPPTSADAAPAIHEALAYDPTCRVRPPLPSSADAAALRAALADGTVDAIATDRTPLPLQRTLVEFAGAEPGMIGLETALSLGLAAVAAGELSLVALLSAMSARPAALIGERRSLAPGTVADLVAFEPAATWRVERETLASVHANTPLLGRQLPGLVRLTVAEGRITYDDLLHARSLREEGGCGQGLSRRRVTHLHAGGRLPRRTLPGAYAPLTGRNRGPRMRAGARYGTIRSPHPSSRSE